MSDFLFAISQALKSFTRRTFVTLLSIITITVTLLVFSLFLLIAKNLRYNLKGIQKRVGVELFFTKDAQQFEINEILGEINKSEWVERTRYISRDEALERFKQNYGDKYLSLLAHNPFPPSIQVYFKQSASIQQKEIEALLTEWKHFDEVNDITGGSYIASRLSKAYKIFVVSVVVWGIILVFAAIIIILNTIKLTISARADSINIMKYVGATKRFIRRPFFYEGILHGLISGVLACGALYIIQSGVDKFLPSFVAFSRFGFILILVIGTSFGGIGSRIAVRKYLKY